jgi:phosphate transport system substrate-binding protein
MGYICLRSVSAFYSYSVKNKSETMKSLFFCSTCLFSILFVIGCNSGSTVEDKGDPLSGSFIIQTDEAHYPVAKVLAETYMGLYDLVNIQIDTTQKGNPYKRLLNKDVRMMLTTQALSPNDSLALVQRGVFPKVSPIMRDAIVMISKRGIDTLPAYPFSLRHDSCFSFLNANKPQYMVTDRSDSDNSYFMANSLRSFCGMEWELVGNQLAIIERVSASDKEVGLVSWSYLCERKSKEVKSRMERIQIMPFVDSLSNQIMPSQSTVFTKEYPLTRTLLMVTSEPYAGPATGFAAWVASSEGQRIIRLFGAAPIQIPPREIQIEN